MSAHCNECGTDLVHGYGEDWQLMTCPVCTVREQLDRAVEEAATLRQALEQIAEQQPDTLAMIERNGFVFDSIGHEPGNWQHLAFTIYTDLCQVDSIARAALGDLAGAFARAAGLHYDAELARPEHLPDERLVEIVRECLNRWDAYPTIPGSRRWARNGGVALSELAARLRR